MAEQGAKDLGIRLVREELARRGCKMTPAFWGSPRENVFDVLQQDSKVTPIWIKTNKNGDWHLKAAKFLEIEFKPDDQQVPGSDLPVPRPGLVCVFVLVRPQLNRFFILTWRELQQWAAPDYREFLKSNGGYRRDNPHTTHTALRPKRGILDPFEDRWELITPSL